MSLTVEEHDVGSRAQELAEKLYREILVTRRFRKYKVDEVVLMEKTGVVSGWAIDIIPVSGSYDYTTVERVGFETSVVHIRAAPGSVIVAVGMNVDKTHAVIVYSP